MLDHIADLLELEAANPFRVRAYRGAARLVAALERDVVAIARAPGGLDALPGIGAELADKILAIATTGHDPFPSNPHRATQPQFADLMRLPGLGPKRIKTLHDELGIASVEQLRRALADGRIRRVDGFGARIEQRLGAALDELARSRPQLIKLAIADAVGKDFLEWLSTCAAATSVELAGSLRRCCETVRDIDILATSTQGDAVIARFVAHPEVAEIIARGPTRCSVKLKSELRIDLRIVAPASRGAALVYLTGSKAHSAALRRRAAARGLKINEYGVFRMGRRIAGESEASVYHAVDLPLIAPELREDRGEIEAAEHDRLPHLVETGDLRGDLHCHTDASDGHDSLTEMAAAASARGLEYIAVTERGWRLGHAPARLQRQLREVAAFNARTDGPSILNGIEVDILEDGSLDLPDSVLGELDLVVGAIHSHFDLPRGKQTDRILRALERPYFSILAHPSGRLIDAHSPYDVDMNRVIRAVKDRGAFLELNAHPYRFDLSENWCAKLRDAGVRVTIASDAHGVAELGNLRFAVGQARRGWLSREDVLNTRPLGELRKLLAHSMGRSAVVDAVPRA